MWRSVVNKRAYGGGSLSDITLKIYEVISSSTF